MKLSNIIPSKTDRAVFVGTTGSGKTYLAKQILNFRRFVVVLDTKGFINWEGYKLFKATPKNDEKTFLNLTNATDDRLIFRPSAKWLRDDEQIEKFFQWIYHRGYTTVYIDEATSIVNTHRMPQGYFDLLVRGREKGIEVFTSTQRPSGIPQVILTESEHCYCFKIRHPSDQKKLFEMFGLESNLIGEMQKHYFIYSKDGAEISAPKKLN